MIIKKVSIVSIVSIQYDSVWKTTKNRPFWYHFPSSEIYGLTHYPQSIHAGVHGRFTVAWLGSTSGAPWGLLWACCAPAVKSAPNVTDFHKADSSVRATTSEKGWRSWANLEWHTDAATDGLLQKAKGCCAARHSLQAALRLEPVSRRCQTRYALWWLRYDAQSS